VLSDQISIAQLSFSIILNNNLILYNSTWVDKYYMNLYNPSYGVTSYKPTNTLQLLGEYITII